MFGTFMIFRRFYKTIITKGFIYYLPDKYKTTLLKRSILDLLCDFWYIGSMNLYIKAVFAPLIWKSDPEQAIKNLEHLEPEDRKIFVTKGIIFIMPKKIQRFLLSKKAAETLGVERMLFNDSEDLKGKKIKQNKYKFGSNFTLSPDMKQTTFAFTPKTKSQNNLKDGKDVTVDNKESTSDTKVTQANNDNLAGLEKITGKDVDKIKLQIKSSQTITS